MKDNLVIIKTLADFDGLFAYIEHFEYIAFDTETVGLHKGAEIIGFSICADLTKAFYVILSYWDVKQQKLIELPTSTKAKEFFELLKTKKLIAHNAPFDCGKINDIYHVDLMPSLYADTLILAHLLDETRQNGLKQLAGSLYGESAKKEQDDMKASVTANGGSLTKDLYELYKGDMDLIATYGAKDALLTLKVFYEFIPLLLEQELDSFYFDVESMPLLKGPTYELNTVGLKVDTAKLQQLRATLEVEIAESEAFISSEIKDLVKDKYPGTKKTNTFNINATQQLAWLLFEVLGEEFNTLTDGGRELARTLKLKVYSAKDKRMFISTVKQFKSQVWNTPVEVSMKTGKVPRAKKFGDPWQYMSADVGTLEPFAKKYKWVEKLLEQKKNIKLLSTYVIGIQEKLQYGVIRPSFNQSGTTSGRYSSNNPNFQNLPRDDKRIKECIISRPGKVFVGADYSQLEPRVFASVSQDTRLLECFAKGEDFYSVVGAPIFGITDCSLMKDDDNSFANKHKALRNVAKAVALATPYGAGASRLSQLLGKSKQECQGIIDRYFEAYPRVEVMMLESHEQAKNTGVVHSLYGRPRRLPEALSIPKNLTHEELDSTMKSWLNLSMNHRVQSSAASIVNRAAIKFYETIQELGMDAKIVLQVHDEIVVECSEADASTVSEILKVCMENTTELPGIELIANPVIAKNLADLK